MAVAEHHTIPLKSSKNILTDTCNTDNDIVNMRPTQTENNCIVSDNACNLLEIITI